MIILCYCNYLVMVWSFETHSDNPPPKKSHLLIGPSLLNSGPSIHIYKPSEAILIQTTILNMSNNLYITYCHIKTPKTVYSISNKILLKILLKITLIPTCFMFRSSGPLNHPLDVLALFLMAVYSFILLKKN